MNAQETATKIPSRFDEAAEKAPTPSPLRASNTLETLRPREATGYETPSGGFVTMDEVLAPQRAYERGLAEYHTEQEPPVTLPKNSGSVLRVVQKTDNSVREFLPAPQI